MSSERLEIETFVDSMFGENAYVLAARAGEARAAWVVDPSFPPQVGRIIAYARERGLRVEKIVLTHGHGDHIAGVDDVRGAFPEARLLISEPDRPMLTDPQMNLSAPFGMDLVVETPADGDLAPGGELVLGPLRFTILDTSGHSPGGRSLYCAEAGVVLTGDALFSGSIGRTDFPGSDHARLIRTIRENLLTLPDETTVYSGHGPATTIGIERKSNPFLVD